MSKSIIHKIYNGELIPEEENIVGSAEYDKCVEVMSEHEDALEKILSGDNLEKFILYIEKRNEYGRTINEESFVQGFRLGAKLMLEITE